MKKLILITLLILTNAVYADGIILNLEEYLQRYPDRIDELGWVTIPSEELLDNNLKFGTDCQYQLIYRGHAAAFAIESTGMALTFKLYKAGILTRIYYANKLKILSKKENTSKHETLEDEHEVTAYKQLSPESISYARNKHLKSILPSSCSSDDFVKFIVNMDKEIKYLKKEANKNCCERYCAIL